MACCGLPLANAACPVLECSGKQDDKPGYVVDGHLSRPAVAGGLKQPT